MSIVIFYHKLVHAVVLLFDFIFLSDFNLKKLSERRNYHVFCWLILLAAVIFRAWYSRGVGYFFAFSFGWTKANYIFTQFWVVLNYLRLLIFPFGQSMDHWIAPLPVFFAPRVFGSLLILIFTVCGSLYFLRESPRFKLLLFAILWFFVTLTPTSSFLPINDAMVERRVYLPMWGFLVWGICLLLELTRETLLPSRAKKIVVFCGACVVFFSSLTVRRNLVYADPVNLWKEAAAMYPDNYRAHFNAANTLFGRDKDFAQAKEYYLKTIALNSSLFEPHLNMGVMLAQEKKFDAALQYLLKANEIRPNDAECLYNLGVLFADRKNYDEALRYCKEAARLDPNHEGAARAIPWLKNRLNDRARRLKSTG